MGGSRLLILLVSCLFLSAESDAVGITLSQSPEKSNQSKGMSDVDGKTRLLRLSSIIVYVTISS